MQVRTHQNDTVDALCWRHLGRTERMVEATLELNPDQAKVIAVAQQMADRLTLALRSVADAQEPDSIVAKDLLSGGDGAPAIQVIKSGVIQKLNSAQPASDDAH